jgi:hypothetical protein
MKFILKLLMSIPRMNVNHRREFFRQAAVVINIADDNQRRFSVQILECCGTGATFPSI